MVATHGTPSVRHDFEVHCGGSSPVLVRGVNWVHALGAALSALGPGHTIGRMAAETLPNGTVIANDLDAGARYVVRQTA